MKIKFCGNHTLHDLQLTANSFADYIGFVFAPSKRRADPGQLYVWLEQVKLRANQHKVGVFVNPSFEEIARAHEHVDLDIIQLHGHETPTQVAMIKNMFQLEVWKVIHHSPTALELMDRYSSLVDAYLIDTKSETAWGGTGETFDWSFIPSYIQKAHEHEKMCFIAGGINPENVPKLLKYKPDGIDLASGIETAHTKDENKITELQESVKQYDYNLT